MSYVYHDALPGYDARQVLHDGCPECEYCGADVATSVRKLYSQRFDYACDRALLIERGVDVGRVSDAEAKLMMRSGRSWRDHIGR